MSWQMRSTSKRFLVALALISVLWAESVEAAVAHFGTDLVWTRDSSDTILDATMTIDTTGHTNNYLHCWVALVGIGATVTSVTWDPATNNQALTSLVAVMDFGTASVDHIQGFGLVNPTSGTAKSIHVVTNILTDIMVSCATFDGVDQTTPIANRATDAADLDGDLTVTAVSGDATTTAIGVSNTIVSTDKTEISKNNTFVLSMGDDYALASGNVTHNWDASGGTQGVLGAAIKQVSAGATKGANQDMTIRFSP